MAHSQLESNWPVSAGPRTVLNRSILLAALVLVAFQWSPKLFADEPAAQEPVAEVPATAGQAASSPEVTLNVPELVRQLDSDRFAEREAAVIALRGGNVETVQTLVEFARKANPEVTARIIQVLTQMYQSPVEDVAIAADEALETLAASGPPVVVVRTQEVLTTTLAPLRRRHAIAAIRRMGGHVIPTVTEDEETSEEIEANLDQEGTVQHVVLGKNWTGGLAGVKYLHRLPELKRVYITTALPFSPSEMDQLKQELAGLSIEQRGSAYLGIKSMITDPHICIIDSVVPNSPAKAGGLKPNDIITHVNGLRIFGFLELTASLSQYEGGEKVYLEVFRVDDAVEVPVTLGEW